MKKWMDIYVKSLSALLMISVFMGCTDDREVFGEYRPSEIIAFTASLQSDVQAVVGRGVSSYLSIEEEEWPLESMEQSKDSRGAVVSALRGLNVGVFGYTTSSDKSEVFDNASFTFVDNEDLLPDGDPVPWSSIEDKPLKVFAYAPKMELSDWNPDSGSPIINYTVPSAVSEQEDIIVADPREVGKNYNQYIPLTFKHVLTGVRFKVGFACKVTSLKVVGVYGTGTYTLGDSWSDQKSIVSYDLITNGSTSYEAGSMLTSGNNTLMMIPQLLPEGAKVILEYEGVKREASLAGLKWEPGKLITYTINDTPPTQEYIYFDLNAGNVTITPTSYSGKVFVDGEATEVKATNVTNISELKFYVYQSTDANKASTGWESQINEGTCRVPKYAPVKVGNKFWSEFITNNTSVENVIETWDNVAGTSGAVRSVGRTHTSNNIDVRGNFGEPAFVCDLTIDNLYSRHQPRGSSRLGGGILFWPKTDYSKLTVNLVGDNRFGNIHYYSGRIDAENKSTLLMNNQLVLQGTGSLAVACVDFYKATSGQSSASDKEGDNVNGYFSNYWCSAIGGDDGSYGNSVGIVIKGGTIFAGTTQSENCTAIGGGGNDKGYVTIEGGTVTAVATTTGTAIGGGIGFNSQGGYGNVKITGGTVFAYNHANEWEIPSAAIGSAGSWASSGGLGDVEITGGYVYAQTALGTAIGGGSSKTRQGGNAKVAIGGNAYVVAKSIAAVDKKTESKYPAGNGIGGGTGGTLKALPESNDIPAYGGSATINISGNPTIRTGSIGGGKTNNPSGKIGSATITVTGGDILGQFVMAGGAGEGNTSSFTMSGNAVISNSDVDDNEYYHVQKNGGAVYMEDGIFNMSGGVIRNCSAEIGGAVYIKKSANALQNPVFNMSGGTIENCVSDTDGGAVYLEVGEVNMSGGAKIKQNLARCGNGGAVYVTAGDFKMEGNSLVEYNSALAKSDETRTKGNGGGIYVTSDKTAVNVEVISGTIQHNTCDVNGGGICVDMSGTSVAANIKMGETGSEDDAGPNVIANEAVMFGGGLYAKGENAVITINSGQIMHNSVANYVPNENVYNDLGTVTLNGGNVTYVTITFDANAYKEENVRDDTALLDGSPTAIQKVVTDTKNKLVQPSIIDRANYNFMGWNTLPDGKGAAYTNGQVINLKENLTLYAQWEHQ